MNEPRPTADWRPLALILALAAAAYAVVYRFLPFEVKAFALWPFGAWALYSGARLTMRVALPLTIGIFALTDLLLFQMTQTPVNYLFYPLLGLSVLIGRGLLARSQAPWRIVAGSVGSYALFFVVSNFVSWLEPARPYYAPPTIETLLLAYREGLEFLRMQPGQLDCGLLLSFGLFGAHALLAKAYFPAERVATGDMR